MKTARMFALVLSAAVLITAMASPGVAHTESDVIAVPAGAQATIHLRPTHGCAGSPTVGIAIQAPVADARPGQVPGWTSSATGDANGNTVLEWTGGSLPANQPGAFPVTFVAPDTVGRLLAFPSIQQCDNGDQLAWISGDPAAEFPAPRLLILPAGSEPASEIDDVAADAPGRSQLVEIVDVDGPAGNPSTTSSPVTTSAPAETTRPSATTAAEPTAAGESTTTTKATSPDSTSDDSGSAVPLAITVGVVALASIVAAAAWKSRRP